MGLRCNNEPCYDTYRGGIIAIFSETPCLRRAPNTSPKKKQFDKNCYLYPTYEHSHRLLIHWKKCFHYKNSCKKQKKMGLLIHSYKHIGYFLNTIVDQCIQWLTSPVGQKNVWIVQPLHPLPLYIPPSHGGITVTTPSEALPLEEPCHTPNNPL